MGWLEKADAVAALGVALIVIFVSLELGKRTIHGLLDAAPAGLPEQIRALVESMPGIVDCHKVRVRSSGPFLFVDAHVDMDGRQSLEEAHRLTMRIEAEILKVAPAADVTVHPEPIAADMESRGKA
jgi:divalent metal cation (Fe/Co/Zn/Cd) transporter